MALEHIEFGTGVITSATFSRGLDDRTSNCDDCYCECHDGPPLPAGVYITVRLDNDEASVALRRVLVQEVRDDA